MWFCYFCPELKIKIKKKRSKYYVGIYPFRCSVLKKHLTKFGDQYLFPHNWSQQNLLIDMAIKNQYEAAQQWGTVCHPLRSNKLYKKEFPDIEMTI